jgi:hypothetical protein
VCAGNARVGIVFSGIRLERKWVLQEPAGRESLERSEGILSRSTGAKEKWVLIIPQYDASSLAVKETR